MIGNTKCKLVRKIISSSLQLVFMLINSVGNINKIVDN